MAQSFTYDGGALTTVIRSSVSFTEKADHGEVGDGSLVLDDDAGTLEIVGHKAFIAEQSACSVARTFTGYVGDRRYSRGDTEMVGAGRQIDVSLLDLNARLGFKVIRARSWNRPAETVSARMTALLASSYLSGLVSDLGFVTYPSNALDKNDYRTQFPLDVIRDCALVAGFNYFVYYDADLDDYGLWFADSNSSTDFTSTLKISNAAADIDSSTTFAASQDTTLERDPSQVISGVLVPFSKGNVYRTRSATATTYEARDGVAPNSQVKKRAKAVTLGDHYLYERRNEEDVINTSLRLPPAKVNLIRAGQRISAKFTHFATEGYGDFSWFRVLERTVTQPLNTDYDYDVALTLSPQECSGDPSDTVSVVQYGQKSGLGTTVSLPAPATAGNLLVIVVGNRDEIALGPVGNPAAGWNYPPLVASPDYSINYVQADTASGGTCECGHGSFYWKQAEGGEQDYTIDNQMCAIFAEFSGFGGTITAVSASAAETSDNLSAVVSATSGAPGVSSIVIGSLITRTQAAGSFTPGAGTYQVGSLQQSNIDGAGAAAFLYGYSNDGSAVTLTGSMSGPYKDGHAAWGMRLGAFEVRCG